MMNEDKYTVSKVILYSERLPFYFTIGNVLLSSINNACQGKIKENRAFVSLVNHLCRRQKDVDNGKNTSTQYEKTSVTHH